MMTLVAALFTRLNLRPVVAAQGIGALVWAGIMICVLELLPIRLAADGLLYGAVALIGAGLVAGAGILWLTTRLTAAILDAQIEAEIHRLEKNL